MGKFRLGNTKASKLTPTLVMQMRKEWASNEWTQPMLARKYQVSIGTVRNVISGVTWQHLPPVVPDEQVMFEAEQSLNRLSTAMEITDPADVGLTPEEIEKISKSLSTIEEPVERVDVTELLKRRSERGGQSDEHQDQHSPTGVLRPPVESQANEGSTDGRGPGTVLAGPLPEKGEEAGETGEDSQSTGD